MTEQWEAPEYVAARKALLDALDLLVDQLDALILVGAQAVYLHAPASVAQRISYTTDSDLVIDPDLLSERPDIGDILVTAGYTRHESPGTFYNHDAIAIDLMVPEGALPPSTRRTAPLLGQSRPTARRTFGLEVALFDAEPRRITALDPKDQREVTLRVAGPAALVVAKLTKLAERMTGPRTDRVLGKDADDLLRLLRYADATTIGVRLRELTAHEVARPTIEQALGFLEHQVGLRGSPLIDLAVDALADAEPAAQVQTAFRTLSQRVLDAYHPLT